MRDIEFRAKRVDMDEWVTGFYTRLKADIHRIYRPYFYTDGTVGVFYDPVVPETIGQYTSLKDKNGVKIFEQDIIKNDSGKIAVVEFGMGKFFAKCSCGMEYQNCDFSQTEVIGNIYENPELLKEGE